MWRQKISTVIAVFEKRIKKSTTVDQKFENERILRFLQVLSTFVGSIELMDYEAEEKPKQVTNSSKTKLLEFTIIFPNEEISKKFEEKYEEERKGNPFL